MSEALYAQMTVGYGYGDDIFNKKKTWAMLNPEQQGQLIQDAYEAGFFQNGNWVHPKMGARPDLAKYMQNVLPQLRNGQGAT